MTTKKKTVPAAPAQHEPPPATTAATYKPSVEIGEQVIYLDIEGVQRPAIVTAVHPPHKDPGNPKGGVEPREMPESVNLEVIGVQSSSEKLRFPRKVTRGTEKGQFSA